MQEIGKVERDTLKMLFTKYTGAKRVEVKQGPAFGVDISLINLGDNMGLAVASDPLSIIPKLGMKESAWLSVHLMANDIATSGYFPQFAQFVLNLPHNISVNDLKIYWQYIHKFCKEINVAITGGHTGFDSMGSTTLAGGGTMLAKVELTKVKSSAYAKPEQSIIMTKTAALSSSAILAKCFPAYTVKHLGKQSYKNLVDSFYQTSVLPEIKTLRQSDNLLDTISALHDVTEGGILGAVYELSEASEVGVEIYVDKIRINPDQLKICELFKIDPLRTIGAGSLLICCDKIATDRVINTLRQQGIHADKIGETCNDVKNKKLIFKNGSENLCYEEKDPYWTAFAQAVEKQLM